MSASATALFALIVVATQVALFYYVRRLWITRRSSPRLVASFCGSFVLALAPLLIAARFGHVDFETNAAFLWGWICFCAIAIGVVAARRLRRMPFAEYMTAVVLGLEFAAVWAIWTSAGGGVAAPAVRGLFVAPAAVVLCGAFGMSFGYLVFGEGRAEWRLGYEGFIGRRYLLSKASPVLSTVTTISVVGVALGVWLVLVALGVLAGFENDLQKKIIGANAHVVLRHDDGRPFDLAGEQMAAVRHTPGVVGAAPFIESEVAIASFSNYTGALLFGIDPNESPKALSVLNQLVEGSLAPLQAEMAPVEAPPAGAVSDEFLPPAPLFNIVIGVEMAKGLHVKVGDKIRVLSPVLEVLTPVGVAPKSIGFRVAAIFHSQMYEYDARFAFVSLAAARAFFEFEAHQVSGLQLATRDPETSERIGERAAKHLGRHAVALDWKQRNATLFSALKLERVVAFVVLVFIILVASFSVVNTLAMSVIEKRKEIAILKTMGARDGGIMRLFLTQGLIVGGFGTAIGATAAVFTVMALQLFGFGIPGEVYYIDSLPVRLTGGDVVLVVLAALLIVWDFAVFPSLRGSRLKPVEGLRDG